MPPRVAKAVKWRPSIKPPRLPRANPARRPDRILFVGLMLVGVAVFHKRALAVSLAGLLAILAYEALVSGFPTGFGAEGAPSPFRGGVGDHPPTCFLLLIGFEVLFEPVRAKQSTPTACPICCRTTGPEACELLGNCFCSFQAASTTSPPQCSEGLWRAIFTKGRVQRGFSRRDRRRRQCRWSRQRDRRHHNDHHVAKRSFAPDGASSLSPRRSPAFALVRSDWGPCPTAPVPADPCQRPAGSRTSAGEGSGSSRRSLLPLWPANITRQHASAKAKKRYPWMGLALWAADLDYQPLRRSPTGRSSRPGPQPERSSSPRWLPPLRLCRSKACPTRLGNRRSASAYCRPVFDNIPLTVLALKQGGYDWALLAYAVGFGGSMVSFGSSAGVALTNRVSSKAGRSSNGSSRDGSCQSLMSSVFS